MNRIALLIEYDGAGFHGWQKQPNLPSVQTAIETAIKRYCGQQTELSCAGRTDAGVHAKAQVAHVDLVEISREHQAIRVMEAVNYYLKGEKVAIIGAQNVEPDFHARFDALWREYEYHVVMRKPHLVLEAGKLWRVPFELDVEAMRQAASMLVGTHNFNSFRDSDCQAKSPIKTLDKLDIEQNAQRLIFKVKARSFLHHQVRIMVGTLVEIGRGRFAPSIIPQMLEAGARQYAGMTAPADGLFFTHVEYEKLKW